MSSMVAMRLRKKQIHEMSRFIRYTQNLENLKTLKHSRQKSSGHLQGIGEAERTFRDITRRLCLGHYEFHCSRVLLVATSSEYRLVHWPLISTGDVRQKHRSAIGRNIWCVWKLDAPRARVSGLSSPIQDVLSRAPGVSVRCRLVFMWFEMMSCPPEMRAANKIRNRNRIVIALLASFKLTFSCTWWRSGSKVGIDEASEAGY